MHVRTFQAADASAALAQVKAELGAQAVILDTRSLVQGGRRLCEIDAGVADEKPRRNSRADAMAEAPGWQPAGQPAWQPAWQKDWAEIKDCLATLMGKQMDKARLAPRQRQALDHLERQEVDQDILLRLYNRLVTDRQASLLGVLGDVVPCRPLGLDWPQRLHAVAGPSGVGRTTTALRLALATRAENPEACCCLVNADLRQAKGKLVLRHYAELSGFAYREADTARDMAAVLAEAKDFDRVFIDLPAVKGQGAMARLLQELGLAGVDGLACHLVLSPVYGRAQLAAYLETFLWDGAASLIWTKLDEAAAHGAMINVSGSCGLPISALAYGPGIRETLAPAESMHLWRLLFKHQLPGAAMDGARA